MVLATKKKDTGPAVPTLYRHKRRPEWGAAIRAWQRDGRVAYQFEDGTFRVFSAEYLRAFEPVDRPADTTAALASMLKEELRVSAARRQAVQRAALKGRAVWKLSDQVKVFRVLYPDGFAGEKWIRGMRGNERRRLKRHRVPAAADARRILGQAELRRLLEEKEYKTIVERALDVARTTSLFRPADVKVLKNLPSSHRESFALSLFDLLYGEAAYHHRFDRFVKACGDADVKGCSWELATAFPALIHPEEHVPVRVPAFRRQAEWMAPAMKIASVPSGALYLRILKMVRAVRNRLQKKGYAPRDLLDVYDFILVTTRPAARKLLRQE